MKNSNFYKFFSYNWFKIIKNNIKNNKIVKLDGNSRDELSKLIFKKEFCGIAFVVIHFLIMFVSSVEMYKTMYRGFIFFRIFKDYFLSSFLWFLFFTILPFVSILLMRKKIKSKYYILLCLAYLLSNVFNILLSVYFITAMINTKFFGILGIINIVFTILINCNIIIKIKENYLK